MGANRMSKEQRQEVGRRTQAKLRARIAAGSLPQDYYAQLGRKGFMVTLVRHGPERLAQVLSAFYGRPIDARLLERNREREREHAATRHAYPLDGQTCAQCGGPAEARDHQDGWRAGHAPENIALLCHRCHVDIHVRRIKAS